MPVSPESLTREINRTTHGPGPCNVLATANVAWLHEALVELRQQRLRNAYILSHGDPWAQSVCRGEHDAVLTNEKGPPA